MSTLTWLDTSEADRRQALDVIDAFRDRDTRDELGLGTIRDGLAEILFPGTTTIQTRARYFLFIPWTYLGLEGAKVPSSQVARRARAAEVALIRPLVATGEDGVIGRNVGADLRRLASAIYWQGLGSWGIRRFPGSQDRYHRSLDAFYRRTSDVRRDDDLELIGAPSANWDAGIPTRPPDFPDEATLEIRPAERRYLRDRVVLEHPDSLLAALIRREVAWSSVPFAWEVPDLDEVPAANREQLHHARSFSELIHGAQLLYNLLLSEASENLERIERYRGLLGLWAGNVDARLDVLETWARDQLPDFWHLLRVARVPPQTRRFVEAYLTRMISIGPEKLADDTDVRALVRKRECFLKRKLARLVNATSLSMWGGAAGASQLDVRWRIGERLLLDILPAPGARVLEPHSRRLLLDALAPPAGYRFDRAVGTTFTLDLLALLTAPLAFSLIEVTNQDGGRPVVDPLALLEAARRHAERIAIFTDAGHVAVPTPGQPLLALLEETVVPVVAPSAGGLFHPKVWLVRYVADAGPPALRLLCSSRNLTFDRSWDTVLVLDGEVTDGPVPISEPLADFIEGLPALAVTPPAARVADDVRSLAADVRRTRFEPPQGLELKAFHPMGVGVRGPHPLSGRIDRILVVSPFVGGPALKRFAGRRASNILVSRPEELVAVAPEDLRGYPEIKVLSDVANPEVEGEDVEERPAAFVATGLHAKVYVADAGWDARMWVGSANATDQAFGANVEFLVELSGRKRVCGIDAVLHEGERDVPGLGAMLDDYEMHRGTVIPDPDEEGKRHLLDEARAAVARTSMTAVVAAAADDAFELRLESRPAASLALPDGVRVRCQPASLGAGRAVELRRDGPVHGAWSGLGVRELSAFFAVSVEITGSGETERFTVTVPLEGVPADRGAAVLSQIIVNRRDLVRFLLLLLAADESSVSERIDDLRRLVGLTSNDDHPEAHDLPLLEPMLRALSRDPGRIDQIARVIDELGATQEGRERLPEGLDSVWPAVLAARAGMRA